VANSLKTKRAKLRAKQSEITHEQIVKVRAERAVKLAEKRLDAKKKWLEKTVHKLERLERCKKQIENSLNRSAECLLLEKTLEESDASIRRLMEKVQKDYDCGTALQAKIYFQNYRQKHWLRRTLSNCRNRAAKKLVPFDMNEFDLLDKKTGNLPVFCPVFPHIKLDYNAGPDRRLWASVDRIVPELGYVSGNVWIVSMAANTWKSNGSNATERTRIVAIMQRQKKNKSQPQMSFLF
jgi:hypothetical protein